MPAEAGDDTIAIALVLHLEHHPLVRLVGSSFGFGDDAVESRTLESLKPVGGDHPVSRCRGQMKRHRRARQQRFESCASLGERRLAEAAIVLT